MKVIIVGAGEVGFHIARHLAIENKDVVVIDVNNEAIRRISDNIDVQTVVGSGSSPVILNEAGLKEAEILLAVTNSDETNLVACLVANVISPATRKLARLRNSGFDDFHNTFRDNAPYIETSINPEIEVVKTIERLIWVPGAVDVGEFAGGLAKLIGIRIDQNSGLINKRLSELSLGEMGKTFLITAVIRNEQLIIPTGKDRLQYNDLIYFISEENRVLETLSFFGKRAEPVTRAMIIGGGNLGLRLASLLEEKDIDTKLIEKDQDKCAELAGNLNKTLILHGDGSNKELLMEENIKNMDVVITLTGDEQTNILTSLLAKQMGARKTITKVNKFSYFPLMSTIGIEQIVSPRLSAVNTILQHIRKGKVLSAISIKGEQAEVLEAVAMETSNIVNKPLHDISFPKGALVISIIRDNAVIIPSGNSIIKPDDKIIIFARKKAITDIEQILAVKLEFF